MNSNKFRNYELVSLRDKFLISSYFFRHFLVLLTILYFVSLEFPTSLVFESLALYACMGKTISLLGGGIFLWSSLVASGIPGLS